eukprot:EG_transcript_18530
MSTPLAVVMSESPPPHNPYLDLAPGTGHRLIAARILYRQPMKQLNHLKAVTVVCEPDLDPEHEILSRSVVRQVDGVVERLPTDETALAELCKRCGAEPGCGLGPVCEASAQLLEAVGPWLIYGTKDCGHVIAHLARRLFEYALRGAAFALAAAKMIKAVHTEQVARLRAATELKSKPHSIRRVVLNLVQNRFYLRPGRPADADGHHRGSLCTVHFIGQLLIHDLLVDSAVHESLAELLRPRNRPDTLSNRLEMACRLLSVAGPRLDQGACMDPYYHYIQKLMQSPEVNEELRALFEGIVAARAAWLQPVPPRSPPGPGPPTPSL